MLGIDEHLCLSLSLVEELDAQLPEKECHAILDLVGDDLVANFLMNEKSVD